MEMAQGNVGSTISAKHCATRTIRDDSPGSIGRPMTVKVRMYRQGLGDCFLISLPREKEASFHVLIDCGVILGTPRAAAKMQAVVQNIHDTTGGKIDLLVATHEHWDHLSGFLQARELFRGFR